MNIELTQDEINLITYALRWSAFKDVSKGLNRKRVRLSIKFYSMKTKT